MSDPFHPGILLETVDGSTKLKVTMPGTGEPFLTLSLTPEESISLSAALIRHAAQARAHNEAKANAD